MAKNLTDSATWATVVSVPTGGDTRTASTVETPFQQLANRSAYLKDKVDVSGVNRIRYVSSIADAQALTGLTTNDVVLVKGYGTYVYSSDGLVYGIGMPWEFNVTSGGALGKTDEALFDYVDGVELARKIVRTDDNGIIYSPDIIPNRTVYEKCCCSGATDDPLAYMEMTGDTNWHDVTDGVTPMWVPLVNVLYGDTVYVSCDGAAIVHDDHSTWRIKCALVEWGGTQHEIPGMQRLFNSYPMAPISTYPDTHFSMSGAYTVATLPHTSICSVLLYAKLYDPADTVTICRGISLTVRHVRPGGFPPEEP